MGVKNVFHIDSFTSLKSLFVSHNRLTPKCLPWQIVRLKSLEQFSVNGNPLAVRVDWAKKGFETETDLNNAIRFLTKYFNRTLLQLNMSRNAFNKEHFYTVLNSFPELESLDASYNPNFKTTASIPLQLPGSTKQLQYLSLQGNHGIGSLHKETMFRMDREMTASQAVYNIEGIGWNGFTYNFPSHDSCIAENLTCQTIRTFKFPWKVFQQVSATFQYISIENVMPYDFTLKSDLCRFPNLTYFEFKFNTYNIEHFRQLNSTKAFYLPECAEKLTELKFLKLRNIGLALPNRKIRFPNLQEFNYESHKNTQKFHGITTQAMRTLTLRNYQPIYTEIPVEYGNLSILKLGADFAGDADNVTWKVPLEWREFECLRLDPVSYNYSNAEFGSLGHLTINNVAVLETFAAKGAIFRVGPQFKCMVVFSTGSNAYSLWDTWQLNCTNATEAVYNDMHKHRHDYEAANISSIQNVLSCNMQTSAPNTFVSVHCAAFKSVLIPGAGGYVWHCFSEDTILTRCKDHWDHC